jgi:hypothetical protein
VTLAIQFFTALYAGQTGVLELRTFGPETSDQSAKAKRQRQAAYHLRDFVPVEDGAYNDARLESFLYGCAKEELGAFFGVALRSSSSMRDRKGDAAHCHTLTTLFVDADFKYLGETETRRRLATFSTPPAVVVNSGGGLHPYWLLRQPLDLRMTNDARTLLQRLAYSVAAIVDTSVSEPVRVLRIPGSLNFKYDPPRPVTLEHISDTRIDPADLPLIEVNTSGSLSGGTASGVPLHLPETIVAGARHELMRNLMRSLQARGVGLDGALAACHLENLSKCRPPLDRDALDGYLRRVAGLPDRPTFTRTPQTGWELAGSLIDVGLSVAAVLAAVRSVTPGFDPEVIQ